MCQPVVGKLPQFFAIAVFIAVTSISKQRRTVMKKNTKTSESGIPDQALEGGSGQRVTVPRGPKRIFTALNGTSFLYFKGFTEDRELRLHSTVNLFNLWEFEPSESAGAYYIRASGTDFFMIAVQPAKVFVSAEEKHEWEIWDVGNGYVNISNRQYSNRILKNWSGSTVDDTVVGIGGNTGGEGIKYRIDNYPA